MPETMCPVCRSRETEVFLKRERVPVHQNLLIEDQDAALGTPRGDICLAVCPCCGFVFNQAFELAKLSYGRHYDNTQECSAFFRNYLNRRADYLLTEQHVTNCRIMEIGCGNGTFLRRLVEPEEAGNTGTGFDPSYTGPPSDLNGRLTFHNCYYGPQYAGVAADVVICRHVIEHVPDPMGLLSAMRKALTDSPGARVFVETPCAEWIFHHHVIWDVFYEHCSYFSAASLARAFEASGFRVERTEHVFVGQYLWAEATLDREAHTATAPRLPARMACLAEEFAARETACIKTWAAQVQSLAGRGRVALWGAGAKGVTFANLIDPQRQWIACVVDINPQKQGHYLPGTGHPIVGHQGLTDYGIRTALILNPNYYAEIAALVRKAGLDVELIDLMELPHETDH